MLKEERWHSRDYEKFVASLPCCICGGESEVHHIRGLGNFSGAGLKADSILTMPLCHACHMAMHSDPELWESQCEFICRTVQRAVREGVLKYVK